MNKRDWVLLIALCVMMLMLPLILTAAFIIAFITFPAYAGLILGLIFLLSAGFDLYEGINRIRRAKAQGTHISWWKQSPIVYALSYGGYASTVLIFQFIHDQKYINIALYLFFPISIVFYIYAFILSWKQKETNKKLGRL
jgi:hypothetical protein